MRIFFLGIILIGLAAQTQAQNPLSIQVGINSAIVSGSAHERQSHGGGRNALDQLQAAICKDFALDESGRKAFRLSAGYVGRGFQLQGLKDASGWSRIGTVAMHEIQMRNLQFTAQYVLRKRSVYWSFGLGVERILSAEARSTITKREYNSTPVFLLPLFGVSETVTEIPQAPLRIGSQPGAELNAEQYLLTTEFGWRPMPRLAVGLGLDRGLNNLLMRKSSRWHASTFMVRNVSLKVSYSLQGEGRNP